MVAAVKMENPPNMADESLRHRNNQSARRKPKLLDKIFSQFS
jgi:hypothetical protein